MFIKTINFCFLSVTQHAYCDGIRTQSNRQFPDGAPKFLAINVEFLVTAGVLGEKDIPDNIQFLGKR